MMGVLCDCGVPICRNALGVARKGDGVVVRCLTGAGPFDIVLDLASALGLQAELAGICQALQDEQRDVAKVQE